MHWVRDEKHANGNSKYEQVSDMDRWIGKSKWPLPVFVCKGMQNRISYARDCRTHINWLWLPDCCKQISKNGSQPIWKVARASLENAMGCASGRLPVLCLEAIVLNRIPSVMLLVGFTTENEDGSQRPGFQAGLFLLHHQPQKAGHFSPKLEQSMSHTLAGSEPPHYRLRNQWYDMMTDYDWLWWLTISLDYIIISWDDHNVTSSIHYAYYRTCIKVSEYQAYFVIESNHLISYQNHIISHHNHFISQYHSPWGSIFIVPGLCLSEYSLCQANVTLGLGLV